MTTPTCPNGHESTDAEWCDTCGAKIGSALAVPPTPTQAAVVTPVTPVVAADPVACPHCGEANPADALFCEVCGYDFTTGQAPVATSLSPVAAPSPDIPVAWTVIVEVDQQWYTLKGALAEQPCPPASTSTAPLRAHTSLVGRTSASRALHPEIALDADTGVSRRHAQFVLDGEQLTIVDLSSTNGTYVVHAGLEPDESAAPLVPGVPAVLGDGDRVYVGAWTRLTIRRVVPLPAP